MGFLGGQEVGESRGVLFAAVTSWAGGPGCFAFNNQQVIKELEIINDFS